MDDAESDADRNNTQKNREDGKYGITCDSGTKEQAMSFFAFLADLRK